MVVCCYCVYCSYALWNETSFYDSFRLGWTHALSGYPTISVECVLSVGHIYEHVLYLAIVMWLCNSSSSLLLSFPLYPMCTFILWTAKLWTEFAVQFPTKTHTEFIWSFLNRAPMCDSLMDCQVWTVLKCVMHYQLNNVMCCYRSSCLLLSCVVDA